MVIVGLGRNSDLLARFSVEEAARPACFCRLIGPQTGDSQR
jgi:hypothetical protein